MYSVPPGGGQHWPSGWNTLVYDCHSRRVLDVDRWYDPAHGVSIYANAVVSFDAGTGAAELVKISNWRVEPTESGGYMTVEMPENAADPTPVDRHPYRAVATVPSEGALYLTNGANQTAPGSHDAAQNTWRLDLAERRWSLVASDLHPLNMLDDCMTYDEAMDELVYIGHTGAAESRTWRMPLGTGQWTEALPAPAPNTQGGGTIVYDPVRTRSLFFGGYIAYGVPEPALWSYDAASNAWSRLADAPLAAYAPGFAYDPVHDVFVASVSASADAPNRVLVYDPTLDSWTDAGPPGTEGPVFRAGTFTYDPTNAVFVQQGGDASQAKWFVFRYEPRT
jgi:hypothetical protein